MKIRISHIKLLLIMSILVAIVSCSTQKNTAKNRWWHSFNAKYNTYYNGSLAYIDASLEKENGNRDNYTEIIPLYTVGNKNSIAIGKSNFDRAIEKCEKAIQQHSIKRKPIWDKSRRKTAKDIEWLNRKEFNPFLWKAWLLMGRSQFHSGQFDEAVSTFSYMSRLYETQPAIYGKARAWLAKCFIQQGFLYDAEDVMKNIERDSIHWRAQKEWDYTYADYYLHTHNFEKAIPFLKKVIKHEMRRKQKAREWFLLGQIEASLGHYQEAYTAFKHVQRLNPPYELAFNARIAMTEVMAGGQAKKMISRLRRMAASDNNKEYLDQVYYAIGNIYLTQKDTMQAIKAYEEGYEKATRNGVEKGVLLLHLGNLYWDKEKYGDAHRCYSTAIGLLDKDRKDYKTLEDRDKILEELVPYSDAVELQDSLQRLARMSDKERYAIIDKLIANYKKKEKEQKNKEAEAQITINNSKNGFHTANTNKQQPQQLSNTQQNGIWYFYNPLTVSQGKVSFERSWGKRENVDNWQRSNKTVVAMGEENQEQLSDEQRDSLFAEQNRLDSLENISDSAQNNPHKREYYLKDIPFTEEQITASNKILQDALYHCGIIFKDKLDNLTLSEKALRRITDNYSDYEHLDDVYYHLFLLYSREGQANRANTYIEKLKDDYPQSQWTTLLTDPYYIENAKFGEQIEDSLYAATYEAFKADRYQEVKANTSISEYRFPTGANRDKFLFIGGMSKLNSGDTKGCISDMKTIVDKFANSRLAEMAGMILNGVNDGRKLHGAKFDLNVVWNQRADILNDSNTIKNQKFTAERNTEFNFIIMYNPDSLHENKLLFEVAKFNFTNFLVRNFDIAIDDVDGIHRMRIQGFRNYDEAMQYARQLADQENIVRSIEKNANTLIISNTNLEIIGKYLSYSDYDKFYKKHFATLKIRTFRLLTEPEEIITDKENSSTTPTQEEMNNMLNDGIFIDNGLDIEPKLEGTIIQEKEKNTSSPSSHTTVVEIKEEKTATPVPASPKTLGVTIPTKTVIEKETTKKTIVNGNSKVSKNIPSQKSSVKKESISKKTNTGIYFNDGFSNTKNNSSKTKDKRQPQKQTFDLEDEYYDLEGF